MGVYGEVDGSGDADPIGELGILFIFYKCTLKSM